MDQRLKCKSSNYKTLRKNPGVNVCNLGLGNDLHLYDTESSINQKKKIEFNEKPLWYKKHYS